MSRPIDDKIVKMSLDNRSFLSKVSETIRAFARLDKGIKKSSGSDFSKTTASLRGLKGTADSTTLNKLLDSVNGVTGKFSAMGVMGITALTNITNRAINAGIAMGKAFTIEPIQQGFSEYELKMKSIQTILSNTQGKSSLEDVKNTLGELNTYADQTIYSFADMTSNIGTFTAAGVGLKDSATAIKGIANLAAASGSNSQQASTAMYQLSQALATGSVKLQDWNSVVNAGMGGKLFQNALQKTAKEMGVNVDQSKSFRDSLQDGWLTSEVLLKTLSKFSKDKSMLDAATKVRTFTQLLDTAKEAIGSGWATSWEYLIGDFEEAGKMWSNAAQAIGKLVDASAQARNDLIKGFVDLGGRAKIIEIVSNTFKGLVKVMGIVKDAFHSVFPPVTAKTLFDLVSSITDFSKKLIPTAQNAEKLKRVFTGVFSIFSIVIQVVKKVGSALLNLIPTGTTGSILDLLANIGDLITGFDKSMKAGNWLTKTLDSVGSTAKDIGIWLKNFSTNLTAFFVDTWNKIKDVFNNLEPYIKTFKNSFKTMFEGVDKGDVANLGLLGILIIAVKKLKGISGIFENFADKMGDFLDNTSDFIKNIGGIRDALSNLTTAVKAGTLIGIAVAVGILAVSVGIFASLDAPTIVKALSGITGALIIMISSMKAIAKVNMSAGDTFKAVALITAVSGAIFALSVALKIMSTIDTDEMNTALKGLAGTMGILAGAIIVISRLGGKMTTSAIGMVGLATSVVILASALKILSGIDEKEINKSLIALGAILGELAIFLRIANKQKLPVSSALGLVITSGAILVIVEAVRQIADLDVETLKKGLTTVGIILAGFAGFTRLARGNKMVSAGVGILIVAQAIKQLVPPLKELGKVPYKELIKGLGTMVGLLVSIVAALKLAKGTMGASLSIVAMAGAINLLVPPLKSLGKMSLSEIAKGLLALAGAFTVMGVASKLIGAGGALGLLAFAAAIGAIGLAIAGIGLTITALVSALQFLSESTTGSISQIVKNLGTLVDGMTSLVPKVWDLAVTIVMTILKGLSENIGQIVEYGGTIIVEFLKGMTKELPRIVDTAVEFIVTMAEAFSENVGILADAGVKLIIDTINAIATAIDENSEALVGAVLRITGAILVVIVDALTGIVSTLFGWIPGVKGTTEKMGKEAKEGLREYFNLDETGKIGKDGASGFNSGITGESGKANKAGSLLAEEAKKGAGKVSLVEDGTNAASEYTKSVTQKEPEARKAGTNLAEKAKSGAGGVRLENEGKTAGQQYVNNMNAQKNISEAAGKKVGENAKKGAGSVVLKNEGKNAGQQYVDNLQNKSGSSRNTGRKVANSAKQGAGSVSLSNTGKNAGVQFANAVGTKSGSSHTKGRSLANSAKSGASGVSLYSVGRNAGEGFAGGIESKGGRVSGAASYLGGLAEGTLRRVLSIFSPSRKLRKVGDHAGEGFALGIEDQGTHVEKVSKGLADKAISAVSKLSTLMNDSLSNDIDMNPVITPVLDTSKLSKEEIQAALGDDTIISTEELNRRASNLRRQRDEATNSQTTYDLHLHVEGELPDSSIKRMARTFSDEIKNIDNRKRSGKGEEVYF